MTFLLVKIARNGGSKDSIMMAKMRVNVTGVFDIHIQRKTADFFVTCFMCLLIKIRFIAVQIKLLSSVTDAF